MNAYAKFAGIAIAACLAAIPVIACELRFARPGQREAAAPALQTSTRPGAP